jgi:FkbM family methyltransferase
MAFGPNLYGRLSKINHLPKVFMEDSSYSVIYWQYLQKVTPELAQGVKTRINDVLQGTHWEEPQSSLDFNNLAVLALVEAEACRDETLRELYLETAIAALNHESLENTSQATHASNETRHPLCVAHLALVQNLLGNPSAAIQLAFSSFIELQPLLHREAGSTDFGLVFLPSTWRGLGNSSPDCPPYDQLTTILEKCNGYQQCLLLLGEILCQSQFVFYNPTGLRFLQLAVQLYPQSASRNLSLGISSLMNGLWEGLFYLHRANQLLPHCSPILQSLYLAYKDLGQLENAETWRMLAKVSAESCAPVKLPGWQWAYLPVDSPITYGVLENTLPIAIESSFQSIVTGVLLAQGKWFEAEMEFWQDCIQPGMTIIDVGANVGVYTFSAAQRVGPTGCVLAVEPFSGCVWCLEETCRVNQLDWVKVCRGAASDRNGTVQLNLHHASELNQVITNSSDNLDEEQTGQIETVPCFRLDTLMEQEKLDRVDMLKIDAEGHELQVLQGGDRLLEEFSPVILYENLAGKASTNLPVAEFLVNLGYQLFRYQPYLKKLIPIESQADLATMLNIIAIRAS